jgi:hypothetical protein
VTAALNMLLKHTLFCLLYRPYIHQQAVLESIRGSLTYPAFDSAAHAAANTHTHAAFSAALTSNCRLCWSPFVTA